MSDEHPAAALLQGYLARSISAAERDAIEAHVDACEECRLVLGASATQAAASRAEPGPGAARLPVVPVERYLVETEIARGGLGKVLRATHVPLARTVAIKEMIEGDQETEARFMREVLITAKLQHPGIVPILDAGRWPTGEPFYSMKLLAGRTLASLIAERREVADRLALLPHIAAVAAALAYAHGRRIIHRDVKPANIVVGELGETVLIDWGIAKELDAVEPAPVAGSMSANAAGGATATVAGGVLGTPLYMAPEQARGEPATERSDVYALGLVLYEVLTGVAPPRADAAGRRRLVPALQREPRLPLDLVAIADKAVAHDPAARYPTAKELAEDIVHFETGRLIGARQYGALELVGRWVRRHAALVTVAGAALALLIVVVAVSFARVTRASAERERQLGLLHLDQARQELFQAEPQRALAFLAAAFAEGADGPMARFLVAHALATVDRQLQMWRCGAPVGVVAVSAGGARAALGSDDGAVRVVDLATGAEQARVYGHAAPVTAAVFDPAGDTLVTADAGGLLVVSDAGSGARRWAARGSRPAVVDGGRLLAATGVDGDIVLHRLADGAAAGALAVGPGPWTTSADGERLAAALPDGGLAVYTAAGAPVCVVTGMGPASGVALDRTGALAARARRGQPVELIDVGRCAPRAALPVPSVSGSIGFTPDGTRLYSLDGMVHVWDAQRAVPLYDLGWHTGGVVALAYAAGGQLLVTVGSDRTMAVWFAATGALTEVLRGHDGAITTIAVAPDDTFITGSLDGTARRWRLARPGMTASLDHGQRVLAARFAGGSRVVTLGRDGAVSTWSPGAARADAVVRLCHPEAGERCLFDAAGDRVLRVRGDAVTSVALDGGGAVDLRLAAPLVAVNAVDGAWVTAAGRDGEVVLWNASDGSVAARARVPDAVTGVAWSRGHARFATCGPAGLAVWSAAGGLVRRFPTLAGSDAVVAFDPSGTRVLGPNETGDAAIWEVDSGRLVAVLEGHVTALSDAAFSPDGAFVATVSTESARLQDSASGVVLQYFNRTLDYGDAGTVAFDPGGARLVVAGVETFARVWSVAPDPGPADAIRADVACHVSYRLEGSVALPVRAAPSCR